MRHLLKFSVVLFLLGCQTAQQKRVNLVDDRRQKLKALSTVQPMQCLLLAHLTEPASARYRQMFPNEATDSRALTYTYRVRSTSCEITPLEPTELSRNYNSFLQTGLCVLLQTHFINSPFDGIAFAPDDIEASGERVHVRTLPAGPGVNSQLGMYLDPEKFTLETRTKSRGTFRALYAEQNGAWLPKSIEQIQETSRFRLDQMRFQTVRPGARPLPRSLEISVGENSREDKLVKQSKVDFTDCMPD